MAILHFQRLHLMPLTVALHDVKKLYNAAKTKLGELKAKVTSQSAAAAPIAPPPPPLLLVAAKSFAASHSLPTLQPDDPNSFFASIEALITVLERNLAEARSQSATAQNALKTPPASPPSQNSEVSGSVRAAHSAGMGLSRLSISPIAGGTDAEREAGSTSVVTTFASITGSGAFTSPKKAAAKQSSADPASTSSSSSSSAAAASVATTTSAIDSESLARIQLHNIDLQRRVERLQMSMKVTAICFPSRFCVFFFIYYFYFLCSHACLPFYSFCRASKAILRRSYKRRTTPYGI
jgi:hypothetical protein